MNLSRSLLSVGLGVMIFSGVLFSEFEQYKIYLLANNPLQDSKVLEGIKSKSETHFPETVLTQQGDLYIFFGGVRLDFTGDVPNITDGAVYIDSQYHIAQTQQDVILTFGDLSIQSDKSKIYVEIQDDNTVEIYAVENAIKLSWDNSNNFFLVPAGYKVSTTGNYTLKDKGLSENKRQLKMQTYQIESGDFYNPKIPEQRIHLALKQSDKFKSQMTQFAYYLPLTWGKIPVNSVLGRISQAIKYLQSQVGLGLPETKVARDNFEILADDLTQAHRYIEKNRPIQAKEHFDTFSSVYNSSRWDRFIYQYPSITKKWKAFEMAHRYSFYGTESFAHTRFIEAFWTNQLISPIEQLQYHAQLLEKYAFRQQFFEAQSELDNMKKIISQVSRNTYDKRIPLVRQIIAGVLTKEKILQTELNFQLYTSIVQIEQISGQKDEQNMAIQRDLIQEILGFLEITLEQPEQLKVTQALLDVYKQIDLSGVAQTFGATDFTKQQRDTISFINKVGGSGLTSEDIRKIQEQRKQIKTIEQEINILQGTDLEKNEESGIQTIDALNDILVDINVKTDLQLFSKELTINGNTQILFQSLLYDDFTLSGNFDTQTQTFRSLTLHTTTQELVPLQHIGIFLRTTAANTRRQIALNTQPDTTIVTPAVDFVPQRTADAILQRRLVREIFISEDFKNVSSDNIRIINKESTLFKITNMVANDGYEVELIYDKVSRMANDVIISRGSLQPVKIGTNWPLQEVFERVNYEQRKRFDPQFDPIKDLHPFDEPSSDTAQDDI